MGMRFTYLLLLLAHPLIFAQEQIKEIGNLPMVLAENSGMIFYNGKLITHNDSGDSPVLYELDTVTMAVNRSITITNATNVDWEDIAQDDAYIYVGDFGNNHGIRSDLGIYKISKEEYSQSESVTAEKISFSFEDQIDFVDNGNSDWDVEALFVLQDQLFILTKQWNSKGTIAYAMPKTIGSHIAKNVGNFDIQGLVTGSTYNIETNELLILGHSVFLEPFVYKVSILSEEEIFIGDTEKLDLDIGIAQVEAIALVGNNRYMISSEFFTREIPSITLNPKLFALQLPIIQDNGNEEEIPEEKDDDSSEENQLQLSIYPTLVSNNMAYELKPEQIVLARAIFDTTGRRVQFDVGTDIDLNEIDLTTLKTAVYYLTFYLNDKIISKSFFRK